jgi:hypothetical protein
MKTMEPRGKIVYQPLRTGSSARGLFCVLGCREGKRKVPLEFARDDRVSTDSEGGSIAPFDPFQYVDQAEHVSYWDL